MREDAVLDCYWLAKHYAVDPDVFLRKPLSVVQKHMQWTKKLVEVTRAQQEDDNAS